MVSRDVERAADRLRAFQVGALEHFTLAAIALGLALVASRFLPAFALPLLVGGIASLALGVRDEIRRWDLIDRVVLDRDACQIPVVLDRARRAATMKNRRALSSSIRILLAQSDRITARQVDELSEELETLARRLDDPELTLDPVAAITCERLLTDVGESPLLDPSASVEDARARIRSVLAGFRPGGSRA
jgi:hypothetical protein